MKRSILLAAAMLIAVGGAYYLGRSSTPHPSAFVAPVADDGAAGAADGQAAVGADTPAVVTGGALPDAATPLKDSFTSLQARANAGDLNAAARLTRDLDRCRRLRGSQWKNSGATETLTRRSTDGMSAPQLRTYQLQLEAMELRQQAVQRNQALCAGVDEAMLDSLVPNIAQAARLGDEQARACYLGRGPLYDARSLIKHPEALRNYRGAATALINRGLAGGDWRVVDLLQQAYEPGSQSLLAGVLGSDPVQHYRYLKLYRLGAESHRVAALDQQLAAVAASLGAAELAQADQWAQTTLRENFRDPSTSTTPPGWDACEF